MRSMASMRGFLPMKSMNPCLLYTSVVLFDYVEKLDDFTEMKAPVQAIIFDYYLNFVHFFINQFSGLFTFIACISVSYTHLDMYKRQDQRHAHQLSAVGALHGHLAVDLFEILLQFPAKIIFIVFISDYC